MHDRTRSLALALASVACATPMESSAPSAAPETAPPRVFVEALVLDVPSGGLAEIGIDPSTASFDEIIARAGARHVSSPHAIVADGATMRPPRSASRTAEEATFEDYELAIEPRVVEHDRVRLGVDFALDGKRASSTVVVASGQLIVLGTEIMIDGRRCVLLVRPNVIRSDADLDELAKRKANARHQAL